MWSLFASPSLMLPSFTDSKMSFLFWRPPTAARPEETPDPTPCPDPGSTCSHGNSTRAYNTVLPPISQGDVLVEYIGYVFVMPIICVIGIILNSLTVLVLNCRQFKSPTYTYLSALAVADIITCIFTLPIGTSRCGDCVMDNSKLIYEVYVFMPLTNMSETMSAWMVVLLAAERLITVKRTTAGSDRTYKESRFRARCITAGVAVGSVALNMPYFFAVVIDDEKPMMNDFDESGIGFSVFSWTRATLVQFLPLILLIILNCFLLQQIRRSHQRYRRLSVMSRQSMREHAQLRLTLMLSGTVVLFIIGNIPVALAYTVLFQAIFGQEALYSDFYVHWRVITHLISIMCYGLDFSVYCAANPYFRQACASVLTCHRKRRKISDVSSSSDYVSPGFNTPRQGRSPENSTEKVKF